MPRVLFLGQKPIGESCFTKLCKAANLDVVCAVSNPSADNTWWKSNNIYLKCLSDKIMFISNEQRNSCQLKEIITQMEIDTIISVQHSWILEEDILSAVHHNAFNMHLAKLPDYKGYYAYNHAILNKEKEYFVTIHWMDRLVDQGDIAFEKGFTITPDDTAYSLYEKAQNIASLLFDNLVSCLDSEHPVPRNKMNSSGRFYSKKSLDSLREIQNISDSAEITLKARAFYFPPYENAYLLIDNKRYYVVPDNM